METEIESESIDMTTDDDAIISFSRVVDDAIHSRAPSNLGETSPLHSFRSVVDSAIRSRTPSNLGASGVVASASVMMRTVAARLSQVEVAVPATATRYVAAQLFTLAKLEAATNKFSRGSVISDRRSFGAVYKGSLVDRRGLFAIKRGLVAIKRKENWEYSIDKSFLSHPPHHNNLVDLVGVCENMDRKLLLLVYEYMNNGSLYDHLHCNYSVNGKMLNSWRMRIKIALDASQGIEYLHNHADPPIIHGNIKSSNILLDATWTARVSDYERSFMNPEPDGKYGKEEDKGFKVNAYLDPEYCPQGKSTKKSDVYGFGVVLLELLTGKDTAYVDYDIDGLRPPLTLVPLVVSETLDGDLSTIWDPRVRKRGRSGSPNVNEAEALELVASIAVQCVNFKGKDRPTMAHIVINLERALAICDRH